tara:strand:+ start:5616 stop:5747 length:132 start_codon:yes stop_codon:yes gene_type:complete
MFFKALKDYKVKNKINKHIVDLIIEISFAVLYKQIRILSIKIR